MLARLLRIAVLALLAAVLAWCACALRAGLGWPWVLLGAAAIVCLPAAALAVEFGLLARVEPGPDVVRPHAAELLRAWAGEVRASCAAFGWRQPFAARREPDAPDATGQRGVVLVHGYLCNRGLWSPWLRRLRAAHIPAIAVTLEPVFGSIDAMVPIVDAAVARLQDSTGRPPLVVAHSMGGLVVRAWLRAHRADARIAGVVTVASPHHGTGLARFGFGANARQMRLGSAWIAALAAAEPVSRRALFTCFHGHCDNIVFPAVTARLEGAANHHLGATGHVAMIEHPAVYAEVMRRLRA